MRPFTLHLAMNQAAKITRDGCAYTIEPMRFLFPFQAKREVRAINPNTCHHNRRPSEKSGDKSTISKNSTAENAIEQTVKTQAESMAA